MLKALGQPRAMSFFLAVALRAPLWQWSSSTLSLSLTRRASVGLDFAQREIDGDGQMWATNSPAVRTSITNAPLFR